MSPTEFLALQGVDRHYDLDQFGLELYDIHAGSMELYYPGSVSIHAFDPDSGAIAFVPIWQDLEPRNPLEDGLYLVSPSEPVPRPIGFHEYFEDPADRNVRSIQWRPELGAFLSQVQAGKMLAITPEGEIVLEMDGVCSRPEVSPSTELFAFTACSYFDRIEVRNWNGDLIDLFDLGPIGLWFWAPDSAGVYFIGERSRRLNYLALGSDEPVVIHDTAFVLHGGDPRPQWVGGGSE